MMNFEQFRSFTAKAFPSMDEVAMERFKALEPLYHDWNARINVVSRKDIDSIYDHHVLHSLAIARYISQLGEEYSEPGRSVLDLGTGGGFPGIPLAIMYPSWSFTLCDSVGKKTTVARSVAEALSLDNVRVVNARAESLEGDFDFVVSRAVAPLDKLWSWVGKKLRYSLFCLKGGESVVPEIAALMRVSGLKTSAVHSWEVDSFLPDDYFLEKFVIHIEKNYLCSPKNAQNIKNR